MCDCPREYSGSSCQDPAEGYCRRRAPDYLNSEDDLALVGVPEPCACNGHSTTCDPETCQCTVVLLLSKRYDLKNAVLFSSNNI